MARSGINKRGIGRFVKDIQKEFDKHPIMLSVEPEPPDVAGFGSTTTNYYGPVIHGSADGAQLAWGNQTAHQTQKQVEQIAPGFEALAQAVASTLEQLAAVGLPMEDVEDAETLATEVLAEVVQPVPDRGKIRRAVAALKGFLAPVATGVATGTADGAQEWARAAIEQLGTSF